jgi:hypothetical protein
MYSTYRAFRKNKAYGGWLTDHLGGYQAGIFALAAIQLVAIVVTLALRPRAKIEAA